MTERWRSVVEDPRYLVSNHGRLRSLRGRLRHLRPSQPGGYCRTSLQGRRNRYMHHLVLLAFVGPKPTGTVARHLDGNPMNNTLTNLAWGTPSENERDKVRHGRDNRGESHSAAKLTAAKVVTARKRRANGETNRSIAASLGVSASLISLVCLRKSWAHVA